MQPVKSITTYQICVAEQIDARWLREFEGLVVAPGPNGETVISGLMDQSALHGVIERIRDLGLELISVQRGPLQERKLE